MTNEIEVRSRVWHADDGNGTVKDFDTDRFGRPVSAVKFDSGSYRLVFVHDLTLIPDTVTIEIPRELRDDLSKGWYWCPEDANSIVKACQASKDAE